MLLLLALVAAATAASQHYSVMYENSKWVVKSGAHIFDAVATAEWEDTRPLDGWTRLRVHIVPKNKLSDSLKYFAAGYLEGYINQHLIFAGVFNFANSSTVAPVTAKMSALINGQLAWMQQNVKSSAASDPYWARVGTVLQQFDGIIAGYHGAAPTAEQLTRTQLLAYVLQFEIGDYAAAADRTPLVRFDVNGRRHAVNAKHPVFMSNQGRRRLEGEHCSVLIKPSADGKQLLAGHVTWSSLNTMLRVYKTYDFPNGKIQFSSFPGLPMSGDDWFINGHQLMITETTNEIFNTSLYEYLTTETIPYWIRVQVANDASTAPQWHTIFARYNNGGYNNQWSCVDYKLFVPGKPLVPNTFVVGEQAPGLYVWDDQSAYLNQNGYWGSYNVPFYKQVWEYSGYAPLYAKFGNAYSWSMCARAQIYRRDQHTVQDLHTLKVMQRYNKWQTDPLALQDSCRGISARCDLNSPWQNGTLNGFSPFGAIDGKVTNDVLAKQMISHAISGPTYFSQPIFWWSNAWDHVPTLELPRVYNFNWVEIKN